MSASNDNNDDNDKNNDKIKKNRLINQKFIVDNGNNDNNNGKEGNNDDIALRSNRIQSVGNPEKAPKRRFKIRYSYRNEKYEFIQKYCKSN